MPIEFWVSKMSVYVHDQICTEILIAPHSVRRLGGISGSS